MSDAIPHTIPNTNRKIIHVDMDAFYASVEQRDFPELRGKAIAVGGSERRGVTTTASYEARKYGVRSALPGWKAKELCPHLIFVKPRFDAYKKVSQQIRGIFAEYTDIIEPLSLDEAFLDVTDNKKNIAMGMKVAQEIKDRIEEVTHLTSSAGVSYCKFIAKIASDMNKPDGLTVIHPDRAIAFIENLAIEKFFGVGKVTARRMKERGIYNGADLKQWNRLDLAKSFGKSGNFYYDIVRGIDNRPVRPNRVRKSIAVERTLEENIENHEALYLQLEDVLAKLKDRITKAKATGRTVTLKLKTADFQIITRSHSKDKPIDNFEVIEEISKSLLKKHFNEGTFIRLIGVTLSNLDEENNNDKSGQLKLGF